MLHQIWIDEIIPSKETQWMNNWKSYCLERKIAYQLWRKSDCEALPIFGEFTNWLPRAFAADLLRLEIIYSYGGMYIDSDCELLQPIGDWLAAPLTLVTEHKGQSIFNGFFGANKNHPIVGVLLAEALKVVSELKTTLPNSSYLPTLTGPHAWRRWLKNWKFPEALVIEYQGPLSHCIRNKGSDVARVVHHHQNAWKGIPIEKPKN